MKEDNPRVMEAALKGQAFLNAVSAKAHELQLPPDLTIRLFGLYMKRILENAIENGHPKDKVVADMFTLIGQGMDIEMEVDRSALDNKEPLQ